MRKTGWIVGGVLVTVLLLVLIPGIERGRAPGLVLFVGRFHPTVVHFPIALLLVSALVEVLAPRFVLLQKVRPAVPFLLGLGAVSALVSVLLGYLLSLDGGYEAGALSLHQWMGLLVAGTSVGLAAVAAWSVDRGRLFRVMTAVLAVLVVVAGHLGATLTRGSGYLTFHLPVTVKTLIGLGDDQGTDLIANIDSALVYHDLIQPIFDRRCTSCHGPNKAKGDLRLDGREGVARGGRDGVILVAGNPAQSEIVRRVTLPPHHEDAMPPDGGPPLDVGETEVIRWWIASGASFDARVAELDAAPSAVNTYLARVSMPRLPERSGILALDVPDADSAVVAALVDSGLVVRRLAADAPFVEVSAVSIRDRFGDAELRTLQKLSTQISVLDLGHTQITESGAVVLATLPHLTHLHLQGTAIGDGALAHLRSLQYLEYLNLYGTDVSDVGLAHLYHLPALHAVYLWRTNVSEAGAEALRQALPRAEVNRGSTLALISDSTAELP